MWTHNHRLVKYMYMSMRRCDARLQVVPNPYYLFFTYQYVNVILTFTLMFQIPGFVFLMSIKQEIFTVHNMCCQESFTSTTDKLLDQGV